MKPGKYATKDHIHTQSKRKTREPELPDSTTLIKHTTVPPEAWDGLHVLIEKGAEEDIHDILMNLGTGVTELYTTQDPGEFHIVRFKIDPYFKVMVCHIDYSYSDRGNFLKRTLPQLAHIARKRGCQKLTGQSFLNGVKGMIDQKRGLPPEMADQIQAFAVKYKYDL